MSNQFLDDCIRSLFFILLDENISKTAWENVISEIIDNCSERSVYYLFDEVMHQGRTNLIYLFCKLGCDPFLALGPPEDLVNKGSLHLNDLRLISYPSNPCPPPIFGLCRCKTADFEIIFKYIFKGMQEFQMKRLAGLKDKSKFFWVDQCKNEARFFETNFIMTAMENDNDRLFNFLSRKSDLTCRKTTLNCGWPLLNHAVVLQKKESIKHLIEQGHSIHSDGTKFDTEIYFRTMARKCFKGDTELCKRAFSGGKDAYDLSQLVFPSLSDYIKQCMENYQNKLSQ